MQAVVISLGLLLFGFTRTAGVAPLVLPSLFHARTLAATLAVSDAHSPFRKSGSNTVRTRCAEMILFPHL